MWGEGEMVSGLGWVRMERSCLLAVIGWLE